MNAIMNEYLAKVGGFFTKEFWIASFLPTLCFLVIVFLSFLWIGLGAPSDIQEIIEKLTFTFESYFLIIFLIVVFTFSFFLNASKQILLIILSGESKVVNFFFPTIIKLLYLNEKKRFHKKMSRKENLAAAHLQIIEIYGIIKENQSNYTKPGIYESREIIAFFIREENRINYIFDIIKKNENKVSVGIKKDLENIFQILKHWHENEQIFQKVRLKIYPKILEIEKRVVYELGQVSFYLNSCFGDPGGIKATHIGNIIAAYENYPQSRYGIDSRIFWTRLKNVVDEKYYKLIEEPNVQLNFFVASFCYAFVFFLLILLNFPYYIRGGSYFIFLGVSILSLIISYKQLEASTIKFGEVVRAGVDLFRVDLLKALRIRLPETMYFKKNEVKIWENYSRVVMYGKQQVIEDTNSDFEIDGKF